MSSQPESLALSQPPDDLAPELPESPETVIDATQAPSPAAEEFIQIKRAELHKEIARLEKEDQDFANAFNTAVGRKAARQYQSRLEELQAERDNYQKILRRAEFLAMDPKDVNSRFLTDPIFAREYSELVHHDPNEVATYISNIRLRSEVENILYYGESNGLPAEKIKEYEEAVKTGKYDRDNQGNPLTEAAALLQLQRDIWTEITQNNTPTPPASNGSSPANPPAQAQATPSPAFRSGPDLTPAGSLTPPAGKKYTGSQIRLMSVDDFDKEFPDEAVYQRAATDGSIDWTK